MGDRVKQAKQNGEQQTRRGFLTRVMAALAAPALCSLRTEAATVKEVLPPFDLSFLEGDVPVLRREAWTNDPPRLWLLREAGLAQGV